MAACSSVPAIHIFAVILGSVEIILFGGVIFGWHSVVYVYKDTGYFSSLCPASDSVHGNSSGHLMMTNSSVHSLVNDSTPPFSALATDRFTSGAGNNTTRAIVIAYDTATTTTTTTTYNASSDDSGGGGGGVDGGGGEALSCSERMALHAQGVSAVCKEQDEQFNLIFSLATGINGMLSFPSGFLYDRLGTRISRIFSIVSFVAGQLCLIFASASRPYLLYPGFIGLVYGGYQILLTNLQLSCLIPPLRSTIMSLYSGSYDTSASIFLIFKAAHEAGMSVNVSFTVQAVLYVVIFVSSTFLFLPKGRVPFPLQPGFRLSCFLCQKFCPPQPQRSLQPKANISSSNEWRIDPNGSVILSRHTSRDEALEDGSRGGKSDGINGDAPAVDFSGDEALLAGEGKGETDGDGNFGGGSGGGGGDGDDEGKLQSKALLSVIEAEGKDADSVYDMEVEILAPSDDKRQSSSLKKKKKTMKDGSGVADSSGGGDNTTMQGTSAKKEQKTFAQVALSPLFLTDVMWISVQRLRSWIFVGMFNPWITRLACGDKQLVSHYTSVYAALQFFGILTAPLSGRLMDRKIKGAEKYGNPRYERLHAAIASFVLNSSVSVLLTVCTLIPVLKLQYLTFILHCLHRSFLYGPNSAFVANAFPNEHFGKLFGVTLTVSALFSMLQYPLFLIMQGPLGGDPLAINVFLLVLMLISYIHPIYIWRYLQKKLARSSS